MKQISSFLLFALLLSGTTFSLQAQKKKEKKSKKDYAITMSTRLGDVVMILYEDTPRHRENFLKLVDEGFYDGTTFHRVIKDFMVQGGDPNSKPDGDHSKIGQGNAGYTLEAEFRDHYKHEKGALAAARKGDRINPKRESSSSQFYIVQNEKGTPHLDGSYTIFGRVIQGIEVIDKVAAEPVRRSRPVKDIPITVTAKKMSKKKITKLYGYVYE